MNSTAFVTNLSMSVEKLQLSQKKLFLTTLVLSIILLIM